MITVQCISDYIYINSCKYHTLVCAEKILFGKYIKICLKYTYLQKHKKTKFDLQQLKCTLLIQMKYYKKW